MKLPPLLALGGQAPVLVGSPDQVADEMISWVNDTGIDGFNLKYSVSPFDFKNFADLVVPALQERGAYKTEYHPGSFREKLYRSQQARLPDTHHAAKFRIRS